jgi:hypothetical protein
MQASTCLAKGDARTSKDGEDSQAKAVKYPRTDTRTTNLSADHLDKWSKVDNQRTNAQVVVALVRLDLVTLACPNRKLGSKEVTLVTKWNNVDTLDITF